MRNDKFSKGNILLYCLGIVPVVWLALLVAPTLHDGVKSLLSEFGTVMRQPFHIVWCEDSLKTVLIFMLIYALALAVYLSSARNYRKREEHGSAKWGNAGQVNRKYAAKPRTENKILTQNVAIGLDGHMSTPLKATPPTPAPNDGTPSATTRFWGTVYRPTKENQPRVLTVAVARGWLS